MKLKAAPTVDVNLENKRNLFRFADAFDSFLPPRIPFHIHLTHFGSGVWQFEKWAQQ